MNRTELSRVRWPLSTALGPLVMLAVALPVMAPHAAWAQTPLPPQAIRQIDALLADKATRTPAQRKMSSDLIYENRMRRGEAITPAVPALRTGVAVSPDGSVLVDLSADVTDALVNAITAVGGTVVSRVAQFDSLRARLPMVEVETIAGRPDVSFVAPAEPFTTNATVADPAVTNKVNTSEGDVAHRADLARATYGLDGTGITIGVLSDGVDSLAARQASGDLPAGVTVLPGQAGSGNEGVALLEIAHDLAPGAQLTFATAFGGEAQFAANIIALCAAGATVLVDDVFYFFEAVLQDGIVASGINTAVATGCGPGNDPLHYFSSAGNGGNKSDGTSGVWEGDFLLAPVAPPGLPFATHDFGGGANNDQLTADPPFGMVLQWSDPIGGSANDYDMFLFDPTLTVILASSTTSQTGAQDPREFISSALFNDLNSRLVVVQNPGAADRFLHLNTIRGRLSLNTAGQTAGHAAAATVLGVAAVNVSTAGGPGGTFDGTEQVESFSSDGPRQMFFEPDGSPITPGNHLAGGGRVLQQPVIAAADGVSTATPGFNPFFGTSASAPHAAAIAALILEANGGLGSLSRSQLRSAMTATALDIESPGVDPNAGAGIVDTFAAVGRPTVDVTANGVDGPLGLAPGVPLDIGLSFGAGAMGMLDPAEVYIGVVTPFGRFRLDRPTKLFVEEGTPVPFYSGPLSSVPPTTIFSMPDGSAAPAGSYFWYMVVDDDANGLLNVTFFDFVETVVP